MGEVLDDSYTNPFRLLPSGSEDKKRLPERNACKVLSMALQVVVRRDLSLLWGNSYTSVLSHPTRRSFPHHTCKIKFKKAWEKLLNLKLPLWTKIICT